MRSYFLTSLLHQLRSPYQIFFSLLMPVGMYLIFAGNSYATDTVAGSDVTVSAIIVVHLSFYSAALAAGMSGADVSEVRVSGFSRTLTLAGARDSALTRVRLSIGWIIGALPVTVLYTAGALRGAHMPAEQWLITAAASILLGGMFTGLGQLIGCYMPPAAAGGMVSGLVVMSAFLSDLFTPLQGDMFTLARFMPMFGMKNLITWQLTQGHSSMGDALDLPTVLLNAGVWVCVLLSAMMMSSRATRRL